LQGDEMAGFKPERLSQIPRGFAYLPQRGQSFRAQMPSTCRIGGQRYRRIKILNRLFRQARIQIAGATLQQQPCRGGCRFHP